MLNVAPEVAAHGARIENLEKNLSRLEEQILKRLDGIQTWLMALFSGTILTLLYLVGAYIMRSAGTVAK